jgi:MFS family permease
MKNPLVTFRQAGSLVAGLLIGLSIVVAVSAIVVEPSDWRTLWIFGAPIILVLGFALQIVVTSKLRNRRITDPALGVLPIRFMELIHER